MREKFRPFELYQLERKQLRTPINGPVKYTVQSEGRVVTWLVRKLVQWRFLKVSLPDIKVETIYVDPSEKELRDKIMKAVLESRSHGEKVRFVIGSEDFGSEIYSEEFSFNAGPFGIQNDGGRSIFGIPVQVVPWIKGWAIIPDKMTLKRGPE